MKLTNYNPKNACATLKKATYKSHANKTEIPIYKHENVSYTNKEYDFKDSDSESTLKEKDLNEYFNKFSSTISGKEHIDFTKNTTESSSDNYSGNDSVKHDNNVPCCDDDCSCNNKYEENEENDSQSVESVLNSVSENTDNKKEVDDTDMLFTQAMNFCRDIFMKKLKDYGASWRVMRPQSVTDQIYIKANRIRSLEEKNGKSYVNEGILPEFMAIVNYGIVGLIQLELGYSNSGYDLTFDEAMKKYDQYAQYAYDLMLKKNHDYAEAWKLMRTCSYTDFILMKICRTKQIEAHNGKTIVSEGIDSNYLDMINYAIFGIIKIALLKESDCN